MQFSPIDIFNALVPKDFSSHRIASDIAYGPLSRHRLDIYAPRRKPAVAPPTIVFFHGGGWTDGTKEAYAFAGRAFAALGYVTVLPNYRLVPDAEYPGFLDDCAAAVRWVNRNINQHGGDWTRLVLAGHSAGAYNAMMLALDPDLLGDEDAEKSVMGMVGLSGPYDFFPFDGPISLRVFGGVDEPQLTQPISHARAAAPAMFLGTGGRDEVVLPKNSEKLAEALERLGVAVTLRRYENLDHAGPLITLSTPLRWRAPVLEDVARFLQGLFGRP